MCAPSNGGTVEDVERRTDRYGSLHARAVQMAQYIRTRPVPGRPDLRSPHQFAGDLQHCGSWLEFRLYAEIDEHRLYAGKFCQEPLLCPFCALRRGAKMMRAYVPKLMAVCRQQQLVPWLVTLTVKDGEDLAERVDHLRRCLQLLHQRRRSWRSAGSSRRHGFTEAARAVGAVWSYEVKRGRGSGWWHPHVHCVWLCHQSESIDAVALGDEWRSITGDSYIVDARRFHSAGLLDRGDADTMEALAGDFAEVAKYALKFSGMELDDNWQAFVLLKGRRLVGSLGALRGVEVDLSMLDAPLAVEDVPYVRVIARYIDELQRYELRQVALDDDCGPRSRNDPAGVRSVPSCSTSCIGDSA